MQEKNVNSQAKICQNDDEIDLIELFKVLWKNKIFIIAFTFIVTILAGLYLFIASPWYKATALVEVGYYLNQDKITRLEDSSRIVESLKFKYIDLEKNLLDKNVTVSNISVVKNDRNFFTIEVLARSNELAKEKIQAIVASAAKNTGNVLNNYLQKQDIDLANVNREINFLQNNTIKTVSDQIAYIKNVTVGLIDTNIAYITKFQIPRIEEKISYIKNDVLQKTKDNLAALDKTLKVKEEEIQEKQKVLASYESLIQNSEVLDENADNNKTLKIILAKQDLLNAKNALLNEISSLNTQFQDLVSKKSDYESKIYSIEVTDLSALENQKDKLEQVDLEKLRADKDTIFTTRLPELERRLTSLQSEELNKLLDKRALVELRLKESSYKNTGLVSDIMLSESAAKPKKKLVLAVAFMAGFMLAVFIVFVKDAVEKYKKEEKKA